MYSLRPQNIIDESMGYIVPNRNFIRSTGGAPIAVKMDFTGAKIGNNYIFDKNGHADASDILKLDGQGFSLFFSDSSRNVTIKFSTSTSDTTMNAHWNRYQSEETLSDSDEANSNDDDANSGDIEYTIGISDLNRQSGVTSDQFTKFVFDALKNCYDRRVYANGTHVYNLQDNVGCTTLKDSPTGSNYLNDSSIGEDSFTLSQKHNLRMAKDENGNYYITAYQRYSHSLGILDEGYLGRALESDSSTDTEWWKFKILSKNADGSYNVASVREKYEYEEYEGNPLWIQHGTKANQHTNIFINNMTTSAMMVDVADVTTKDRAVASIDYIDVAIEYALNEATNVGAYLERMEYTEANVTTENENTQAAESNMRDADMAKEITDYTKYNILSQSAQSMLAQANQNMSGVLSLLQ
ncbi:MAG: hypothetical protein IJ728_09480 [Selenomonadaceae bacterium]|nr:hypothetical protein [Selenomonadaceae bacterium]